MTVQQSFGDIQKLQIEIMQFVDVWVHTEKTPIPQKEIILRMELQGKKSYSVVSALNALLRKKYLRRAHTGTKKTFYVQLRGI